MVFNDFNTLNALRYRNVIFSKLILIITQNATKWRAFVILFRQRGVVNATLFRARGMVNETLLQRLTKWRELENNN